MWRDFAVKVNSRAGEYPSFKTCSKRMFFMRINDMWMEGEMFFLEEEGLGERKSPVLVPCVPGKVDISGPFLSNINFSASSKK